MTGTRLVISAYDYTSTCTWLFNVRFLYGLLFILRLRIRLHGLIIIIHTSTRTSTSTTLSLFTQNVAALLTTLRLGRSLLRLC